MLVVLIDTSAFEAHQLSFRGTVFETLLRLKEEEKISVIGTDILYREMESHIADSVKTSINKINKAARGTDRLSTGDLGELTNLLADPETLKKSVIKERVERMEMFFRAIVFAELDYKEVSTSEIFKDYFDGNPPFGEGKKKEEFPDAFVLNALINQFSLEDAIYLVSNDRDWERFAKLHPQITLFKKITEFIDFVNESYENVATERLKELLGYQTGEIIDEIKLEILHNDYLLDDNWIDPEMQIDPFKVKLNLLDFNVIDITPHSAKVTILTEIDFKVEVRAYNQLASYKDPDTREWVYPRKNRYVCRKTEVVELSVDLIIENTTSSPLTYLKIDKVILPDTFFKLDEEDSEFEFLKNL